MHDPKIKSSPGFVDIFGIIICMAFGQVALADSEDSAASVSTAETVTEVLSGQQVYNEVCIACHSPPGVGGAPALGDTDAWSPRIANGLETLINHALNGYSGSTGIMPKKGGRVDLSDEEIIGAIEFMVDQATQ